MVGDNPTGVVTNQTNIFLGDADSVAATTRRPLLRWSGLTSIPSTATVTSVTISLYHNGTNGNTAGGTTLDAYLHRVLVQWLNGETSWNNRLTTAAWATAGCSSTTDRVAVVSATTTVTVASVNGTEIQFTGPQLVTDVQNIVNLSAGNYGWSVESSADAIGAVPFKYIELHSPYSASTSLRPKITVTYNTGGGTPQTVVFEGDSLTYDVASCGGGVTPALWPAQMLASTLSKFTSVSVSTNQAYCGERTDQMITQYSSQVYPYRPGGVSAATTTAGSSYLFLWAGVNDIHSAFTTPEVAYANLKTLWATARADGFKVIAFTLAPLFGDEAAAVTLNTYILSDTSLYDYLIRTEKIFPDNTGTSYWDVGKIHLSATGQTAFGKTIAGYMDTVDYNGCDARTQLLLNGNGSNGGTTFTESSCGGNTKVITSSGNVQTSTLSKKFGSASILTDGTGDFLSSVSNSDFNFSNDDFTVDLWVNPLSTSTQRILAKDNAGTNYQWLNFAVGPSGINLGVSTDTAAWGLLNISTISYSTGTWTHLAIVRSAQSLRAYKDGTQVAFSTMVASSSTVSTGNENLVIGSENFSPRRELNGYVDDVRISPGVARWFTNFTPPTSEASVSFPAASGSPGLAGLAGTMRSVVQRLRQIPAVGRYPGNRQ